MELTPKNVEDLFLECLWGDEENTEGAKLIEGVMMKVGFHPEKLEENKEKIVELLDQCHPNFKTSSGSQGWSFLQFTLNKDDEVWTGEHRMCDLLICLGMGIDKVAFNLPRDYWKVLPGGVPYLQILM